MTESPSPSSAPAPTKKLAVQRRPLLMKQAMMNRMLVALTPLLAAGIYFFGLRVAAMLAGICAVGFATEFITSRQRGQSVSMACFVTCWLYALSLPPTVPFWIAAVGIVVAILFGKEVFGGFGRNFANPAIVGRAFVYVCFPVDLTARFVPAFREFPGGFAHWSFESLTEAPAWLAEAGKSITDAISQASPMWANRDLGYEASSWDLAMGTIGGTFEHAGRTWVLSAGCIGEGCAVLIVMAALYLLATRTANWRLMLSGLVGLVAANVVCRNILGFNGLGEVPPLHLTLLSGTTLYAVAFMVTDPVSAPKKKPAQFAYGALIGVLIVVLRWRGVFVAAATFSILLGNLVGPLLDMAATAWRERKTPKPPPTGEDAE